MDMIAILKLIWVTILITIPHKLCTRTDPLFLSTAQLSNLVETETKLIMILKKHVENQEMKLNCFKRFIKEYERESEGKRKHAQDYKNNAIETYLLLSLIDKTWKDFLIEWETLPREELLEDIRDFQRTELLPTSEDLVGIINAILRLQDVYSLSSAAIAEGILNGTHYGTELTAGDCCRFGMMSFIKKDFDISASWLIEGLQKLEKEYHKTAKKSKIFQHLAYIAFLKDNRQRASHFTNQFLQDTFNNDFALYRNIFFENLWKREERSPKKQYDYFQDKNDEFLENYKKLCSYEFLKPVKETSKLKCQYTDNGNAFLRLARLKEEEIHIDPKIMLYHDVIYDKEIEVLKKISKDKMEIASRNVGYDGVKTYRIAKIYWCKDADHVFLKNVNRRTSDITGLKLDDAEELQMANYGVGGQYEPHFDFFQMNTGTPQNLANNRIGTILFYLNDVEQGGATVFPQLNVTVKPEKGAAVFWYNLYPSGDPDFQTLHAACPVLVGSKWGANKWFHERSQLLTKPCGLSNGVRWKDL